MDRKKFFDVVREKFGRLKQEQVEGFELILNKIEGLPEDWRAYILATTWHETGTRMQPIYEKGNKDYFKKYEPSTKIGKGLGNKIEGDGFLFRGRGFVQITGRANYEKAFKKLGLPKFSPPDTMLEPEIAATVLVRGMLEGWFTGEKFTFFKRRDYKHMRKIVNRMDKAGLIADHAFKFETALHSALGGSGLFEKD